MPTIPGSPEPEPKSVHVFEFLLIKSITCALSIMCLSLELFSVFVKPSKILEASFETDIDIIQENVYNTNRANVFLSKYFPFITQTKSHPLIKQLIKDTLDEFINLHVKGFSNCHEVEINFIGSVSYFLSEEIEDALKRNNLKVGKILQNPIKKLIKFHFEKIKHLTFKDTILNN